MVWNALFVFISCTWVVTSMENYNQPPRGSSVWGYFTPPLLQREPSFFNKSPMEAMVDLTNNLGVLILQDNTFSRGNFAFSPYGVASVLVVLYEGARGESARQIHRAVGFPSDKDIIRIGFRDIHRHLRSYFSHEGYLSGISLNKEASSLNPEYKRILRFYGYDIDLDTTLDEDDDDMVLVSVPTSGEKDCNRTTAATTPSTNVACKGNDTSVGQHPEGSNVESENTTLGSATKDMNVTTVAPKEINETTVQTTVSAAGISTTMVPTTVSLAETNSTTENVIKETSTSATVPTPTTTTAIQTDEVTKINENSSDNDATNNNVEKPPNANEQNSEESNKTTTTMPTTVTEITNNSGMLIPESSVTETIKTTTPTTELTPENITTTTESVISQSETPSTVKNDSNNTETQDNKEGSTTTAESTTENKTQGTNSPVLNNGQQEIASSTVLDPEAVTEAMPLAKETETTESDKIEGVTNSNLDNGMLIPQSEDIVSTQATEKNSEPPPTSTSEFIGEGNSENIEVTTNSRKESTNLLGEDGEKLPSGGKNLIKVSGRGLHLEEKEKIEKVINSRLPLWLIESKHSRRVRTITDYLKSPLNPDLSLQLQNGMYDTHVSRNAELYRSLPRLLFLVDGAIDTPVPMMTYTNIFPYSYIPKLHARALEFPLDDIRYKLLILLPVERRGLRQLIYDLLDYPLSNVLDSMEPARVKAVVPTFMVEGFVILTSSLQKLGIWDVFDPRKANLSSMSTDPELYVRNVEQSVTVVIRNYVEILDIQTRTMAARYMEYEFEATHPFIYFVLDTSTNVALMAGQILDPLNSRIY